MRPLSCLDGEHLIPFLWIKVSVVHVVRCHRWKFSDEYEEQMSAVVDERVKEMAASGRRRTSLGYELKNNDTNSHRSGVITSANQSPTFALSKQTAILLGDDGRSEHQLP